MLVRVSRRSLALEDALRGMNSADSSAEPCFPSSKSRLWSIRLQAIISALLTIAIAWHLTPLYAYINDDTKMQLILSGGLTGTPSPYTAWPSFVLSWLVSRLYCILPMVPWWFVLQVALIFISLYVFSLFVGIACMGKEPSLLHRLLCTCACVGIGVCLLSEFVSLVTFTITSTACASAVIFAHFARLRIDDNDRNLLGLLECLLLALAYSFRQSAFKASMPFLVIAWVVGCVEIFLNKGGFKSIARHFIPTVCGIAVIAILMAINSVAYGSSEWKEFKSINAARKAYMDYTTEAYADAPDEYEKMGWSEELAQLVRNEWFFMDPRVDKKSFKKLAAVHKGKPIGRLRKYREGAYKIITDYYIKNDSYTTDPSEGHLMLLLFVVVIAVLSSYRVLYRIIVLQVPIAILAELVYLSANGRFNFRAADACLIPAIAITLGMAFISIADLLMEKDRTPVAKERQSKPLEILITACGLIWCLVAIHMAYIANQPLCWIAVYAALTLLLIRLLCRGKAETTGWCIDHRIGNTAYGVLASVCLCSCLVYSFQLSRIDCDTCYQKLISRDDITREVLQFVEEHPDDEFIYALSKFSFNDPTILRLPDNFIGWGGWEWYLPESLERLNKVMDGMQPYDYIVKKSVCVIVTNEQEAEYFRACIEQVTGKKTSYEIVSRPAETVCCRYTQA